MSHFRYCLLVFLAAFAVSYKGMAQVESAPVSFPLIPKVRPAKAIYIEALGSSGFSASLNYDMRFNRSHQGWGFRGGVAFPIQEGRTKTYSFPILFNHVSSNQRIALEAGAGVLIAYRRLAYDDPNFNLRYRESVDYPAVANIGIRIQPLHTGVIWRIYWAPSWRIGSSSQDLNVYWIGTSLGIGFN